jgi:hypothetical protein
MKTNRETVTLLHSLWAHLFIRESFQMSLHLDVKKKILILCNSSFLLQSNNHVLFTDLLRGPCRTSQLGTCPCAALMLLEGISACLDQLRGKKPCAERLS